MAKWEKIFGTHITNKGYKVPASKCKNIKEILQINQECQTTQQKNEPRLFSAKSQKNFKGPGTYTKNLSLIKNQGNSRESNSGSSFLTIRFAKVKKSDKYVTLRISNNEFSLK